MCREVGFESVKRKLILAAADASAGAVRLCLDFRLGLFRLGLLLGFSLQCQVLRRSRSVMSNLVISQGVISVGQSFRGREL